MQNLVVSMLRLSAVLSLYGMEQFEKTVDAFEGHGEFSKTMEGIEKALNSLTDVLLKEIDEKKKETLEKVTKISEETVSRTMQTLETVNPKEVLRATTDLLEKTSDATAKWVSKAAEVVEKATESAKPAEPPQSKPDGQGATAAK